MSEHCTDAYIVRIYRRNARDRHALNGVVEVVGDPHPKIVERTEEIVEIIATPAERGTSGEPSPRPARERRGSD